MLSEQENQRRANRQALIKHNINPYPQAEFVVTHNAQEIRQEVEDNPEIVKQLKTVALAGRLMRRRIMGTASFAELQDMSGRIQLYINRDEIASKENPFLYNDLFKRLMDIGDIIGITGYVFKTRTREISIHVQKLVLLSKSLKPLPLPKETKDEVTGETIVYDAFTDAEQRYRQRYVDLIVNPKIRKDFVLRSQMIKSIRDFMDKHSYLEVETPILQPIYGGAAAKPFKTFHHTLDMTLYLRIANELYLKRLIVGGFDGVYEFSKDFRNEGMSRFHNPEFTQVELYVAYKDYHWMMKFMEQLVEKVAIDLHGTTVVKVGENDIDFKRPWKRYTMFEVIEHFTSIDISTMKEEELREVCHQLKIDHDKTMGLGKLIDEIFGNYCEAKLIQPTFITDYPEEMSPLTKKHRDKKGLVERFEAVCNGKEIMNAYTELNDPIDQRQRFEKQLALAKRGDEEAMVLDEDFLRALEYGMPPTAGVGMGIDRLAMIMTNSTSIQDVLFFPQMKPEKKIQVELSEQAKEVLDILYEETSMPLEKLKSAVNWSNKKWDKAIKEITKEKLAKVEKVNQMIVIKVL